MKSISSLYLTKKINTKGSLAAHSDGVNRFPNVKIFFKLERGWGSRWLRNNVPTNATYLLGSCVFNFNTKKNIYEHVIFFKY